MGRQSVVFQKLNQNREFEVRSKAAAKRIAKHLSLKASETSI